MTRARSSVEVHGPLDGRAERILSPSALGFVARLHEAFDGERRQLLAARAERQRALDCGDALAFPSATADLRHREWTIDPVPADLLDRRVEITGPTDRKMVINALNSGASCFMADFEDANSPTFQNMVGGQANLIDAIEGTIAHTEPGGREYRLGDDPATLLVRPRGWHLPERHIRAAGEPLAGALVDFGLYAVHCAPRLLDRGRTPALYLPKLESHLEARLWSQVLGAAEDHLGLERGTFKVTVLIETVPAAFEMDEILWELREHAAGLNAGRWDYLFSMIKRHRDRAEFVLPDRNSVTMTAPFMRAYTELLVRTCHRRGAHAIGGMAALIPSRRDAAANERALAGVAADKRREADDGFDGTWVAHPDLVEVAREQFDRVLGERPNQLDRRRDEVSVGPAELLDVAATEGSATEEGLRNDVGVALEYLASWLAGQGAAAINGLMEDAATAEIARAQIWQWLRHGVTLADGREVTPALVLGVEDSELARIRSRAPDAIASRLDDARAVFQQVALHEHFEEFLTLPAYERLRD